MKNKYIIIGVALALTTLFIIFKNSNSENSNGQDQIFKAEVVKILEQKKTERDDGSVIVQQNLLLKGLEAKWKDVDVEYKGISSIDVLSSNVYDVGDDVLVNEVKNESTGQNEYFVVDFVRSGYLYLLAFLFSAIVILIGRKKGVRSLIGLFITFVVIIKLIIPKIMSGGQPLLVGSIGSLIILLVIIYINEGWSIKSHISAASVLASLSITFVISLIFTKLTKLTGLAQEEAVFLIGTNGGTIDFRGLLLTGILIGAVGVLDDVIVGQVEAVRQIRAANPQLTNKQVYLAAFEVGNSHLGAIVNTLFLSYAGASLPLLLLFYTNPTGTASFSQIINNELISTEIVRTLAGSIGVALSVPVSTFLASYLLKNKYAKK